MGLEGRGAAPAEPRAHLGGVEGREGSDASLRGTSLRTRLLFAHNKVKGQNNVHTHPHASRGEKGVAASPR